MHSISLVETNKLCASWVHFFVVSKSSGQSAKLGMNFVETFGTENQFKLRKSNQWSAAKSIRRPMEDARTIVGTLSLRKEFSGWSWRYPKQFCLESNIFSLSTDFYRQDNDLYSRAIIYFQDIYSRSRIESIARRYHVYHIGKIQDWLVAFTVKRGMRIRVNLHSRQVNHCVLESGSIARLVVDDASAIVLSDNVCQSIVHTKRVINLARAKKKKKNRIEYVERTTVRVVKVFVTVWQTLACR